MKKLSNKDIRALRTGAIAVAAIILFVIGTDWFEHWAKTRKSLLEKRTELKNIVSSKAKQQGLFSLVPAFKMPRAEEKQKFLFRDRFLEQIKKAGIKSRPLEILKSKKSGSNPGYKLLRIKCRSEKCKFEQIVDLLAMLKENPYLAGIEEFKIKCDPKKRQEFKLDIVVSTFVK